MKAAVFSAPGRLSIEARPDPRPGPGEVVVRVRRCGIGEIDLALTAGGPFDVAYGAVLGRECSGEVIAIGSGVEGLRLGDRVAAVPPRGCGLCPACRGGRRPLCTDASAWSGGFAELVCVPAVDALQIGDDVGFAEGALLTPLASALRTVHALGDSPPAKVMVLGGGPVGLCVAFWTRRIFTEAVHLVSSSEIHSVLAGRLGAITIVSPPSAPIGDLLDVCGGPPEVVVECLGERGALQRAIELVARQGRVVSLGLGVAPDPFSPRLARTKGISIDFPYGCSFAEFAEAAAVLRTSGQDFSKMVSSVVGLEDLPYSFERLRRPHDEIKVQLEFP